MQSTEDNEGKVLVVVADSVQLLIGQKVPPGIVMQLGMAIVAMTMVKGGFKSLVLVRGSCLGRWLRCSASDWLESDKNAVEEL